MCNKLGSVREDCGQEYGRCFCKPGVTGIKCTDCPESMELTTDGCVSSKTEFKEIIFELILK
jgi:hypothetical protein